MDFERQKEEFGNAFVMAIASAAGFSATKPSVDDDSVDWTVAKKGGLGTLVSPRLELQLKTTTKIVPLKSEPDFFSYPLKKKNYNELKCDTYVPRILLVVHIPDDVDDWLHLDKDQLILKYTTYWLSLFGYPDTDTEHAVSLRIPFANIFSVSTLKDMMERIGMRGRP